MPELDNLLAMGMTALLKEPATRDAIVEYIKTLTDKNKPTEQWREVYWLQTKEIRLQADKWALTKQRKYRLLGKAYWDEHSRIAMFRAFMTDEQDYGLPNIFRQEYGFIIDTASHALKCNNYMDAIDVFINWFTGDAYRAWEALTEKETK